MKPLIMGKIDLSQQRKKARGSLNIETSLDAVALSSGNSYIVIEQLCNMFKTFSFILLLLVVAH